MQSDICPYGIKAKDLLQREGYKVEDNWLTSRKQIDEFKTEHNVKTTPQIFIDGQRIGGYEDLRRFLGKKIFDPKETSYNSVIAVFLITALMALATSFVATDTIFTILTLGWFISFSMTVLALLKLQNLETFSTMFLN